MPEYDAFGREIGEATLSGLGGGASVEAAPAVEPAAVPTEGSPLRADPAHLSQPQRPFVAIPLRPPRQRRRRGLGFALLCVLFLFIAPLVIGAFTLFGAVDSATESVRDGIDGIKAIPATPEAPAVAPKGVTGRSLVRRDRFAAALRSLSSSELRLTSLRLAPERIDVSLLTRGGRLRNVQVQPGGALRRFGPDSGPGFDTTSTIPFSRLDPRAPQRLARRGAAKLHVPVPTLQYLVPTLSGGTLTWAAYFRHGRYVLGDAAGRYRRSYP